MLRKNEQNTRSIPARQSTNAILTEQTNTTVLRDLIIDIVAAMKNKNNKCLVGEQVVKQLPKNEKPSKYPKQGRT